MKLTIEILKEKFKEAQDKGEELVVITPKMREACVFDIGIIYFHFGYFTENGEYKTDFSEVSYLNDYKIKQPKDEYGVFYLSICQLTGNVLRLQLTSFPEVGNNEQFKLLRNSRTGEICEYDEKLLTNI